MKITLSIVLAISVLAYFYASTPVVKEPVLATPKFEKPKYKTKKEIMDEPIPDTLTEAEINAIAESVGYGN